MLAPELQKLIEASQILTPEKKQWIVSQADKLTEAQKTQLWELLIKEQETHLKYKKKELEIKKAYHARKMKAHSQAAERQLQQAEARQLAALEAEFNNFPSSSQES